MKSLSGYLASYVVSVLTDLAVNAQGLITFDDLLLQTYGRPVPNGYAGLQWNFFSVLEPQSYPGDPVGYLNGMVSPRHVAFNDYANSDGTTTGGFHSLGPVFDLNSAYLTAAWNDGLQVQVSGFVGGLLKYSSAYTLNTTAPTLVNFNFLGIDRVEFISYGGIPHLNPGGGGTQTAIDNLSITIPEPKTISLLVLGASFAGYGLQKRGRRDRKSL